MTRREFIGAVATAVVASALPATEPKPVMHCYENDDGEIIAAGSLHEAAYYHDVKLGGEPEPRIDEWYQISDSYVFSVNDSGPNGETETKTAMEWADYCASPGEPSYVSSTYC